VGVAASDQHNLASLVSGHFLTFRAGAVDRDWWSLPYEEYAAEGRWPTPGGPALAPADRGGENRSRLWRVWRWCHPSEQQVQVRDVVVKVR